MKKPQWITAIAAILIVVALYFVTSNNIFGSRSKKLTVTPTQADQHSAEDGHGHFSIDTLLAQAKQNLTPEQVTRIAFMESSITRGDVGEQQLHLYHQLAKFYADTARMFEPYAWYSAQAARLENSEKSLTFAARLFLNSIQSEPNPEVKSWKALQAKDLFERSLKINPANDSSSVGLGAAYLFGGISENPMEGILMLRKVAEEKPDFIYAQMMLGHASVVSGQLDKALERFNQVIKIDAKNLEATLSIAEVHERKDDKAEAIIWYRRSLPLINIPGLKAEVEQRITDLSK